MADPLSIATGILALIGATNAVASSLRKLHRLPQASDAVRRFEAELDLLRHHIDDMRKFIERDEQNDEGVVLRASIQGLLNKAREKLTSIQAVLSEKLLKHGSETVIKRSTWLRWEDILARLREELRDVRMEMGTCLGLLNASLHAKTQAQLGTLIGQLMTYQQDTFRVSEFLQQLMASIPQPQSIAFEQLAEFAPFLQLRQNDVADLSSIPFPSVSRRARISYHADRACDQEPSAVCGASNVESEGHSDTSYSEAGHAAEGTTDSSRAMTACRSVMQEANSEIIESLTVRDQSTEVIGRACEIPCNCRCHRTTRIRTPDFLRQYFGQALIGYAGLDHLTPPCNEIRCAKRQRSSLRFQFELPLWLSMQGVITAISRTTSERGPERLLRLSRIRPGLDEVFIQVQNGNLARLRQIFADGRGSPHDASDTGWTLLHYATVARRSDMIKFLIQSGADPYAESSRRETPFDVAWNRILSNSLEKSSELALRDVFSEADQLDGRQFTILHRIVLGLTSRSLTAELEFSTAQVDMKDSSGYTPLAWASARADVNAMKILIANGASISATNNMKEQPIHLAAQTADLNTLFLLITASADANAKVGPTGMTPLHFAAEYQNSGDLITGLVQIGAQIDEQDYMGWQPVHWASWRGHELSLAKLIELGADVDAKTMDGNTAGMLAVASNSHRCLEVLIDAGADLDAVRKSGWHVLHYAAIGGTIETLDMLRLGKICKTDIDELRTMDTKQSVSEMLEVRLESLRQCTDVSGYQQWLAAWNSLMSHSRHKPSHDGMAECLVQNSIDPEIEEDDLFLDACGD